jgi:hypothetical protein
MLPGHRRSWIYQIKHELGGQPQVRFDDRIGHIIDWVKEKRALFV